MVRGIFVFVAHAIRAVRLLARDGRIPRPLRGLVVVGVLPIPGPVDEAVLLLAAGLLYAFYRQPMREAWRLATDAERRLDAPGRSIAGPTSGRAAENHLRRVV